MARNSQTCHEGAVLGFGLNKEDVAELYRRFGHALYRRCLSLVGNEAEASELLQETFCQFWDRRAAFEGRSSAFTFLYRIATNLSIDRLRRRRTAGVQIEVETVRLEAADRPEMSEERLQKLVSLTEGLDPDVLTVAVLRYVDGMTQEEIAQALSLSRRTIGKRLKRFLEWTRKRALDQGMKLEIFATEVGDEA